jgi:hypothetical protein
MLVMAAISCTHKDTPAPDVSFSRDIIPIFKTSCAINSSCHSGLPNDGDNINLDSAAAYASIMSKQLVTTSNPTASLLYVEVNSGTMPKAPYAHLPASQVSLLLNWIKQGAKNN